MDQEIASKLPGWFESWCQGPWERDDETLVWMRSRPLAIKKLMLQFPPNCVVRATRMIRVPAHGTYGIITRYMKPGKDTPFGAVIAREGGPEGTIEGVCLPEWLEIIGYYRGITPEVLMTILGPNW